MRPLYVEIHAAIVATGSQGLRTDAVCAQFGITSLGFRHARERMRKLGLPLFGIRSTRPEGGIFFGSEADMEAGRPAEEARNAALLAESKSRMRENDRKARKAVQNLTVEQKRAMWAEKKRKQRQQPLHAIVEHMPALARDGRIVSQHQATFDRQRHATVKVQADKPVDYSRAKVTVCPGFKDTRFVADGPVFSVLNPNECRAWAKAATA